MFLVYPTLCFQLSYPRTQKIRRLWLMKKFLQFFFYQFFQLYILLEYWYPILQTSPTVFNKDFIYDLPHILDAIRFVVRLAGPMALSWLLGFYSVFHVYLNILAELTYFADRNFYHDWWNCRSLQEYWKNWNMPVHQWFVRHLYNPL